MASFFNGRAGFKGGVYAKFLKFVVNVNRARCCISQSTVQHFVYISTPAVCYFQRYRLLVGVARFDRDNLLREVLHFVLYSVLIGAMLGPLESQATGS